MAEDTLKIPQYWKLAEHLRALIQREKLQSGDRVPSLTELKVEFEVSRSTIDKAFDLLENDGLIVRRPGYGTFVASPRTRQPSGLIGIIASHNMFGPETRLDYFTHDLMRGIETVLHRADKRILLLRNDSAAGWDKVDGVIFCITSTRAEEALEHLPPRVPMVSLLVAVDGGPSVTIDDAHGARQAVEYLVSLGHRRIACLMESVPLLARERRQGYCAGLMDAGIEPNAAWMPEPVVAFDYDIGYRLWARENMQRWLDHGWHKTGCTALLAQNDMIAVGALEVLHEAGIRVPEQVSVMGYDSGAVCDCVSPRITAIELPLRQIGAQATELLLREIEQPSTQPESIVLPTQLQVRESTAPPPAAGTELSWSAPMSREARFPTANYASVLSLIEPR